MIKKLIFSIILFNLSFQFFAYSHDLNNKTHSLLHGDTNNLYESTEIITETLNKVKLVTPFSSDAFSKLSAPHIQPRKSEKTREKLKSKRTISSVRQIKQDTNIIVDRKNNTGEAYKIEVNMLDIVEEGYVLSWYIGKDISVVNSNLSAPSVHLMISLELIENAFRLILFYIFKNHTSVAASKHQKYFISNLGAIEIDFQDIYMSTIYPDSQGLQYINNYDHELKSDYVNVSSDSRHPSPRNSDASYGDFSFIHMPNVEIEDNNSIQKTSDLVTNDFTISKNRKFTRPANEMMRQNYYFSDNKGVSGIKKSIVCQPNEKCSLTVEINLNVKQDVVKMEFRSERNLISRNFHLPAWIKISELIHSGKIESKIHVGITRAMIDIVKSFPARNFKNLWSLALNKNITACLNVKAASDYIAQNDTDSSHVAKIQNCFPCTNSVHNCSKQNDDLSQQKLGSQNSKYFEFHGNEFIRISFSEEMGTEAEQVSFWFWTTDSDGDILSYLNYRTEKISFQLSLIDGSLKIYINFGNGPIVFRQGDNLNDGQWHFLNYHRYGDSMRIKIDDGNIETYTLPLFSTAADLKLDLNNQTQHNYSVSHDDHIDSREGSQTFKKKKKHSNGRPLDIIRSSNVSPSAPDHENDEVENNVEYLKEMSNDKGRRYEIIPILNYRVIDIGKNRILKRTVGNVTTAGNQLVPGGKGVNGKLKRFTINNLNVFETILTGGLSSNDDFEKRLNHTRENYIFPVEFVTSNLLDLAFLNQYEENGLARPGLNAEISNLSQTRGDLKSRKLKSSKRIKPLPHSSPPDSGEMAQLIIQPVSFNSPISFVTLPKPSEDVKMNVYFRFRTISTSGIIFYFEGLEMEFMCIELIGGIINYVFNYGSGAQFLKSNTLNRLDDNKWHEVTVSKTNINDHVLIVDSAVVKTISQDVKFKFFEGRSGTIYVGGVPEQILNFPPGLIQSSKGYQGCLASFNINGWEPDLILDSLYKFDAPDFEPGCTGPAEQCIAGGTNGVIDLKIRPNESRYERNLNDVAYYAVSNISGQVDGKEKVIGMHYLEKFNEYIPIVAVDSGDSSHPIFRIGERVEMIDEKSSLKKRTLAQDGLDVKVYPNNNPRPGYAGRETVDLCHHEGRCIQHWNTWSCDCRLTGYAGTQCSIYPNSTFKFGMKFPNNPRPGNESGNVDQKFQEDESNNNKMLAELVLSPTSNLAYQKGGTITYYFPTYDQADSEADVLALGFATVTQNGMLMTVRSSQSNDHIEILLENGNLLIKTDLGAGEKVINVYPSVLYRIYDKDKSRRFNNKNLANKTVRKSGPAGRKRNRSRSGGLGGGVKYYSGIRSSTFADGQYHVINYHRFGYNCTVSIDGKFMVHKSFPELLTIGEHPIVFDSVAEIYLGGSSIYNLKRKRFHYLRDNFSINKLSKRQVLVEDEMKRGQTDNLNNYFKGIMSGISFNGLSILDEVMKGSANTFVEGNVERVTAMDEELANLRATFPTKDSKILKIRPLTEYWVTSIKRVKTTTFSQTDDNVPKQISTTPRLVLSELSCEPKDIANQNCSTKTHSESTKDRLITPYYHRPQDKPILRKTTKGLVLIDDEDSISQEPLGSGYSDSIPDDLSESLEDKYEPPLRNNVSDYLDKYQPIFRTNKHSGHIPADHNLNNGYRSTNSDSVSPPPWHVSDVKEDDKAFNQNPEIESTNVDNGKKHVRPATSLSSFNIFFDPRKTKIFIITCSLVASLLVVLCCIALCCCVSNVLRKRKRRGSKKTTINSMPSPGPVNLYTTEQGGCKKEMNGVVSGWPNTKSEGYTMMANRSQAGLIDYGEKRTVVGITENQKEPLIDNEIYRHNKGLLTAVSSSSQLKKSNTNNYFVNKTAALDSPNTLPHVTSKYKTMSAVSEGKKVVKSKNGNPLTGTNTLVPNSKKFKKESFPSRNQYYGGKIIGHTTTSNGRSGEEPFENTNGNVFTDGSSSNTNFQRERDVSEGRGGASSCNQYNLMNGNGGTHNTAVTMQKGRHKSNNYELYSTTTANPFKEQSRNYYHQEALLPNSNNGTRRRSTTDNSIRSSLRGGDDVDSCYNTLSKFDTTSEDNPLILSNANTTLPPDRYNRSNVANLFHNNNDFNFSDQDFYSCTTTTATNNNNPNARHDHTQDERYVGGLMGKAQKLQNTNQDQIKKRLAKTNQKLLENSSTGWNNVTTKFPQSYYKRLSDDEYGYYEQQAQQCTPDGSRGIKTSSSTKGMVNPSSSTAVSNHKPSLSGGSSAFTSHQNSPRSPLISYEDQTGPLKLTTSSTFNPLDKPMKEWYV